MKRFGQTIQLKPEGAHEQVRLHAETWPRVQAKITDCTIRYYSIFRKDNWLLTSTDSNISPDPEVRYFITVIVFLVAWVLSALFNLSLEHGQPIANMEANNGV